jgi:pimeloyl-ACP methyl ester carboxylesterase
MDTWVLLRGLTRESRHWGSFAGQFQQAFPESRVLAPDLPGNGLLNGQRSPSHVGAMVEYCRGHLQQLQIEPPFKVLAMSLGAMVSVAWSQAYPRELAAQVLINTSMRPLNAFYQRLQSKHYATLLQLLLTHAAPDAWERVILRMTSNQADASVLALWLNLRRQNPVTAANALRQLLAAARFQADLAAPEAATLLLVSARDQLVSPACSSAWAKQWQCPLRTHPRAGHDLPLDDGHWVIAQVLDWLAAQHNCSL